MSAKIFAIKCFTNKPEISSFYLHSHSYYEIYCFLQGGARYLIEDTIYNLKPGDILLTKKQEEHKLLLTKEHLPYERIVVHFDLDSILGDTAQKFEIFINKKAIGANNCYSAKDINGTNLLYYLEKISSTENTEERRLYLTVFLNELCDIPPSNENCESTKDSITSIINYINRHLSEEISLDKICDKYFISKSHLIRKFKTFTGVTVWSYIRSKRLNLAKELLENGQQPKEVFLNCGFNDYCSFFKAYKEKFGVSPKFHYKKI